LEPAALDQQVFLLKAHRVVTAFLVPLLHQVAVAVVLTLIERALPEVRVVAAWEAVLVALEHLDKETTEEPAIFTLAVSLTVAVAAVLERLETTPQPRRLRLAAQAPHQALLVRQ
jgi:hypothetical protein